MIAANEALYKDWQRNRAAEGHKDLPRHWYALSSLERYCGGLELAGLQRADIQAWLGTLGTMATSSRSSYYSSARAFYNWASSEDEQIIGVSPMRGMKQPADPLPPAAMPAIDEVKTLIAATEADKSVFGTRDVAMIRLMCDTGGPRATEVAMMLIAGRPGVPAGVGLDLDRDLCAVKGKGGLYRRWPISARTGRAAARWIRKRDQVPAADAARLWTGYRQPGMTYSGVEDMLERRCKEAGVRHITPHKLRHFSYHHYLLGGGRENDAMILYGWTDDTMPRRYARELAAYRALEAGHALAIGDQW